MTSLSLVASSKAILTGTAQITDPDSGAVTTQNFPCDLQGHALTFGAQPLFIFRDAYTGKTFARVAEVIPSGSSSSDREAAAAILALKPTHFVNDDGSVKGWFVAAPDFNGREAQ